jgi:phenylalanyl-tRNA synthetase alpha chain
MYGVIIMYKLTEEGKQYLENGLPEINLVNALEKPLSINKVKSEVKNFSIALSWAKKHKWVKLEKGKLIRVSEPGRPQEQNALEMISKGRKPESKILKILIRRKLVEEERDDIVKKAQKLVGKKITNLTPELIKTGMWDKVKLKPYNVTATGVKTYAGKRQPYNQFLDNMRTKLFSMGFTEVPGQSIITEFWNFDALYQAQNHPSRDWTQTYSLKYPKTGKLPNPKIVNQVKATHENGWKTGSTGWGYKWDEKKAARLMPIAHDTAISPKILVSNDLKNPGKYFQIVRCFRPDIIDATHGVEFNQMGGIVVGENLNFKHLLGLLKEFVIETTGFDKVRFKPDYFPFVEPGVEVSAKHPELGWVELAGAGIGRPEVHQPLGMKEPILMWGFGIERLAMMKLGINDIRDIFSRDLDHLRRSKLVF